MVVTDLWPKAEALAETYSLEEIIEMCDMEPAEVIYLLIKEGYLDPEVPMEIDLDC